MLKTKRLYRAWLLTLDLSLAVTIISWWTMTISQQQRQMLLQASSVVITCSGFTANRTPTFLQQITHWFCQDAAWPGRGTVVSQAAAFSWGKFHCNLSGNCNPKATQMGCCTRQYAIYLHLSSDSFSLLFHLTWRNDSQIVDLMFERMWRKASRVTCLLFLLQYYRTEGSTFQLPSF